GTIRSEELDQTEIANDHCQDVRLEPGESTVGTTADRIQSHEPDTLRSPRILPARRPSAACFTEAVVLRRQTNLSDRSIRLGQEPYLETVPARHHRAHIPR